MVKSFRHNPIALEYVDLESQTTEIGRKYITPTGNIYPSITTVLGFLSKKDILAWRKRVGEEEANRISRQACARGTKMHTLVEKYLQNEKILIKEEMPHIQIGFNSIKQVLDQHIDNIRMQETPLFSDHLGVAGRVDLIAEFDGRLSVIDIKTSSRVKTEDDIESYFMQESAYAIMFEERTKIPITQLVTLMVVDSDPNILVFKQHRDKWSRKLIETINAYKEINESRS